MPDKPPSTEPKVEFRVKFFWETLRSVVFAVSAALATYFIFTPFEAQNAFENRAAELKQQYDQEVATLKVDYDRTKNELQLDYENHVQKKVFENRMLVVDEFIIKSDRYTKLARNVFESEAAQDIAMYEGDTYDDYKLQIARLEASFGDELQSMIVGAGELNDAVHVNYKSMVKRKTQEKAKDIWEPAIDRFVESNRAITRKAVMLQFKDLAP